MKITLAPIGKIEKQTLEDLRDGLHQAFGCPVDIAPEIDYLNQAYDADRRQYLAPELLSRLRQSTAAADEKVLAVVDVDLYAPGLNFIFGQASTQTGAAIISLHRLRQEYYGLPPDRALFTGRAVKEAIHEMGHTFGLQHCPDSGCVMHFSNSLPDTDRKGVAFCGQCRPKLLK